MAAWKAARSAKAPEGPGAGRAVALGLGQCRGRGEQGGQAVTVFGDHGLLVKRQQVRQGLAFPHGAGRGGCGHTRIVTGATPRPEEPEPQEHAQVLAQVPPRTAQ